MSKEFLCDALNAWIVVAMLNKEPSNALSILVRSGQSRITERCFSRYAVCESFCHALKVFVLLNDVFA